MVTTPEVELQVRYALSQLPAQNAHHEFEHICRRLTEQFICSNVLPATGPVSAGGDQGRDFETFRTYLREELGPSGAFLGLVSQGTIAFICTTQTSGLRTKIQRDIEKVCTSGHPVHEVRAFTLESVPVGTRHQLEAWTKESYGVRLEFHDAESVANLIAKPSGFWIAEQFLSIPAEIRPETDANDGALSPEYDERRLKWREKHSPNPTLGDFVDLKTGLRTATHHQEAHGDLPFWLGLVRRLLADPQCPNGIRQRARYELVVATLRGTHQLRVVDDVARAYLEEAMNESEPALLLDASILLMYVNGAVQRGITSLTAAELGRWNQSLTARIQDLIAEENSPTSHRRAGLLLAIGYLGLHPALWKTSVLDSINEAQALSQRDQNADLPSPIDASLWDDSVFADASQTLSAWTELMQNLEKTPLLPIQSLADNLQMLFPLWSNKAEWRVLLDLADEAVGERVGKHTIAARARDRAINLLDAGRCLDALDEFHQAKVEWWSGETIRGSLLSMLMVAKIYLELKLPQASKSYALAASYIAASRQDEELVHLVPAGILMAANADFIAGAWCSATELYERGIAMQYALIEDGTDWEKHTVLQNAVLHLSYANLCARTVDRGLAALIAASTARTGNQELIEEVINAGNLRSEEYWESFGIDDLATRPFADLGKVRHIRFSALGTAWTLVTANNFESICLAERFAAAAQVMLASLAREDLCLVPTQINVRIEKRSGTQTTVAEYIEPLPSNDGREWVVRLAPIQNPGEVDFTEVVTELSGMLATILREVCLLPEPDFSESLEKAFERGLVHKLTPGRPHDELVSAFADETEWQIQRTHYHAPWDCRAGLYTTHHELGWNDGPGPTYSRDKAEMLLQTRYQNLASSFRITIPMLASSEEFRRTVADLRSKAWLDWHILVAIFNISMNFRFPADTLLRVSGDQGNEMEREAIRQESADSNPVPIGLFTLDIMDKNRQLAMMALLKLWGLECQQRTPDIPGMERLLAGRYGYWSDDVPHDDPFLGSESAGRSSGLLIVEDLPQQH